MLVINKGLKAHDSMGMINKIIEISRINAPSTTPMTKLPKADDMKIYNKAYRDLVPKVKKFGLHSNQFPSKSDYVTALRKRKKELEIEEIRDFIKVQVNGGFCFDEVSVLI